MKTVNLTTRRHPETVAVQKTNRLSGGGVSTNVFKKLLMGIFAVVGICALSFSGNAQTSNYTNGFETGVAVDDWDPATQTASGTGGITSASGSFHAVVPADANGAFTRFGHSGGGAYNNAFPGCGYTTSLAIYLNTAGGWSNDTRVDYSSAINNTSGNHRRDFIFSIGFYNDGGPVGSGPRFVVGAGNNSPGDPRSAASPIQITSSGWYTFKHTFSSVSGVLSVKLEIFNSASVLVGTWTLSDPSDVIGSTVGGARYGWVLENGFTGLAIDNSALTITATPTLSFAAVNSRTLAGGSTTAGSPASVSLDFCDGDKFKFTSYSVSSAQVGILENITGVTNNVLYESTPIPVPRPQVDIKPSDVATFFATEYGRYFLDHVNYPAMNTGTITQTYTPYLDVNNDGDYDLGIDCLGTTVTLIYNVSAIVHNETTNKYYCSIQAAIDDASTVAGNVIHVPAGTYYESVVVNKEVKIYGDGYTTRVIPATPTGNTFTIAADNVTLEKMHLEGIPVGGSSATRGIYFGAVAVQDIHITDVKSSLHQYAMYADNGSDVDGLVVLNSEFLASGNGFSIDATAKVHDVKLRYSKFDNNYYGFSSTANSAVTNNQTGLDKVRVVGSTFNGNLLKGLYFEKLNDAEFDEITVNNSGNAPASIQNSGFDINLKFGTYSGISITNSTITNNGQADPNGAGLIIKARSVGGAAGIYGSNPATLTNVSVTNNFFENNGGPTYGAGVRVGDANNALFGTEAGPTGVVINNNSFKNNSVHAIRNASTAPVNATCNWYDATAPATVDAKIGYNATHIVNYIPYLTNGTDNSGSAGFQPVGGACVGAPTDLYVNDNATGGDHYTTAVGNDATGLGTPSAPYLTIAKAMSVASAGNKIWVDAGTYSLTTAVAVNKQVTIFGSRGGLDARVATAVAPSVVDASGVPTYPGTAFDVQPTANESVIDGFTIQGAKGNGGIWLENNTNGTTIQNNIFQNNVAGLFIANNSATKQTVVSQNVFQDNTVAGPASGHGVYADNSTAGSNFQNVLIEDNKFTNASTIVDTWGIGIGNYGATPWTNITIQDNTVDNHGRGVYFYGTASSTVTGNTFTGATNYAVGIFDGGTPNATLTITNNTFTNNNHGIRVEKGSGADAYTGTLTPTGNTFTGGVYHLVNSADVAPATIIDATNNTYDGVLLDGSTSLTNIFAIADKVLDAVDVSAYGKISLRALNQYVTVNSFYAAGGTTTPQIQRGVNAASATHTVNVGPGSFTNEVDIAKDLSVLGQGAGVTTVVSPAVLTNSYTTSAVNKPIIFVHNTGNVLFKGFTVDGAGKGNANYRFQGIGYWEAGGTVRDNEIKGITETPFNGNQHGVAIYADASSPARTLSLLNNTISNFQKNGIAANGLGLTATVDGNTITGIGATTITAQNGVQLGFGATGTITNNTISNISYTPATFVACGVLVYDPSGTVNTNSNTITNTQVGIYYYDNASGNIHENTITATAGGMGATPYWYGINVQDGTTSVLRNTIDLGGNGIGIEADAVTGEATNMTATNNYVKNTDKGFLIYQDGSGVATTQIHQNSITGSASKAIQNDGAALQDATCNWYGTADYGVITSKIQGAVTYVPYLNTGGDGAGIGFQPTGSCVCPAIALVVTPKKVVCLGSNTGKLEITATASGSTFTYSWTGPVAGSIAGLPSGTMYTVTSLPAGTYTVTVTNQDGCTNSATVVILAPAAALDLTVSSTNLTCNGNNSGTLSYTISGGYAPYTVAYTNVVPGGPSGTGTFATAGTYGPIAGLPAGTYTVTLTDDNGCQVIKTATITQPAILVAAESHTAIACNGGTSTVTISATGGTAPYTGTGTFTQSAGTVSYTVTDANGCTSSVSAVISQPTLLVAAESHTAIACNGGTSTVTISATGGTAPYTGTGTFTQSAGTVSYTVTDANGCTSSVSAVISQPTLLVAAESHTAIACNGGTSTVTISATGGTAPYTGTGTFTQSAGTVSYTVTDANGCTSSVSAVISQPTLLVAAESHTAIACNGGTSTVTISATGGTAPYTGTGTFTQSAGTVSYTVTDANGCTSSVSAVISQPTLLVAAESHTAIACNGGTSTVTISATGGTAPYTGTGTFTQSAGTVSYTVTDANGCTSSVSAVISQPTLLVAAESHTAIACNGGTSTVTISATGGTAPYTGTGTFTQSAGTVSYTVTDANGCTSSVSAVISQPTLLVATESHTAIACNGGTSTVTISATGGTAPYTGTGTFTQSAGTVSYTVTDANGCTSSVNAVISQPTALSVVATKTNVTCAGSNNGSITLTPSGATAPYSFTLTGPGGPYTASGATATFSPLAPGTYTYLVNDANSCGTVTGTVTITESGNSDMNLGSDINSSSFVNGTTETVVFNIQEVGGKTVNAPVTVRVFKLSGYTYTYNGAQTSATLHAIPSVFPGITYSLQNPQWTVTANNGVYMDITTTYSTFLCNNGPVFISLDVTRTITATANANLNAQIQLVPTEVVLSNNDNVILLTSQ